LDVRAVYTLQLPALVKSPPRGSAILALMMFYAAHMDEERKAPTVRTVMEFPAAAQYVANWGRPSDLAFIALGF
jgi:hypothetical protein